MSELSKKQLATIQQRKQKAWNKAIFKAEEEAEVKLERVRRSFAKKPAQAN